MQFKIERNQIVRLDKELVTTKNVNAVECSFTFSEDYDGLELFAVFYRDSSLNRFAALYDGKCILPHELLEEAGVLYIGAYGIKNTAETVEKRVTTNAVTIHVLPSLSSEAVPDTAPTPDIWEQYRQEILEYRQEMQQMSEDAWEHNEATAQSAKMAGSAAENAVLAAGEAYGYAETAKTYRDTMYEYSQLTETHKEAAQHARTEAERYAEQAEQYRDEAEAIKNSTHVQYDVQPDRIGIKTGEDAEFTYTASLVGEKGEKGEKGDTGAQGIQGVPGPQGIQGEPGAAYIHPDTHPAEMISGLAAIATSGSYRDLSDAPDFSQKQSTITATGILKGNGNGQITAAEADKDYATTRLASTSTSGLMSATDKTKLTNIADYVVEQGTTSGWYYRKYNSGFVEMFKREQVTLTERRAWGTGYLFTASEGTTVTYPLALTALYYNSVVIESGTALIAYLGYQRATTQLKQFSWEAFTTSAISVPTTATVNYYTTGMWK